jgi:hypothetical protein
MTTTHPIYTFKSTAAEATVVVPCRSRLAGAGRMNGHVHVLAGRRTR